MFGLALRSVVMCPLAWTANIWLGLGSSEAKRLTAAWASVKIVTLSGVVYRLAAVSNALARAASRDQKNK